MVNDDSMIEVEVNDDSIPSKVIRTQTEQFLELFSRTLNYFAPS